ncbi:BTB/POZ protein [Phyllosticta capitalensis]|uniref:BTB/POZ protein n=1 Tax=Phyllosticta capitalensis TaxID=121624 RepID=UPI00312D6895
MASTNDFSQWLRSGVYSDIKVICQGQVFPVHRVIVCQKSTLFKTMLNPATGFLEYNTSEVHLDDEDATVLKVVIQYMYDGMYPDELDKNRLVTHATLFRAANFFGMRELEQLAEKKFRECFQEWKVSGELAGVVELMYSTAPEAYLGLKDMVLDDAVSNFATLVEEDDFKQALDDHRNLSVDVLLVQSNIIKGMQADFGGRSFYCRKCVNHGLPVFDAERVECKACHRAPLVSPSQ